ncbi:MAG TPA: hypothetical protein VI279_02975 [Rhodocyclaceae bacterium]
MRHHCTSRTDLDELIGLEDQEEFRYGPLCQAMKQGEELILEDAAALPQLLLTKLAYLRHGLLIAETGERIVPHDRFRLSFA